MLFFFFFFLSQGQICFSEACSGGLWWIIIGRAVAVGWGPRRGLLEKRLAVNLPVRSCPCSFQSRFRGNWPRCRCGAPSDGRQEGEAGLQGGLGAESRCGVILFSKEGHVLVLGGTSVAGQLEMGAREQGVERR